MMFALGIFNMINQQVQTQKANNEQKMSQANLSASQSNLDDSVMNQKIQQEARANAAVMKMVMLVSQIVLGTLMTLLAPGLGTAFLMAAMTTMDATGATDALTNKLGNAIGNQIAAEVLVGAAEVAATCGGGFVADRLLAAATSTAVKAATVAADTATKNAIEEAAEQAATAAAKAGGKSGTQVTLTEVSRARIAIQNIAQQAAKKAAERTAEQLANQPLAALFRMLGQSGRDAAKATIEKAAVKAANQAIVESETIAKLAADGIRTTDKVITQMTDRIANGTAANAANVDAKTVKKAAGSDAAKAKTRLGWTVFYNIASSDYLIQMSQAIQKARGKSTDDDDFMNFMTFIEVLKQLMQMIAMIGGSGIMSAASFDSSGSSLMRMSNMISMLPQGANAMASYGVAETDLSTATATTALAKNQAIADLLQTFVDQMQKDGQLSRDSFLRQQQQELQSDLSMAGHLEDGDIAGIQVLLSAAG